MSKHNSLLPLLIIGMIVFSGKTISQPQLLNDTPFSSIFTRFLNIMPGLESVMVKNVDPAPFNSTIPALIQSQPSPKITTTEIPALNVTPLPPSPTARRTPRMSPTRQPRLTPTPDESPQITDPRFLQSMVLFGVLSVIVIIFGVYINRDKIKPR